MTLARFGALACALWGVFAVIAGWPVAGAVLCAASVVILLVYR